MAAEWTDVFLVTCVLFITDPDKTSNLRILPRWEMILASRRVKNFIVFTWLCLFVQNKSVYIAWKASDSQTKTFNRTHKFLYRNVQLDSSSKTTINLPIFRQFNCSLHLILFTFIIFFATFVNDVQTELYFFVLHVPVGTWRDKVHSFSCPSNSNWRSWSDNWMRFLSTEIPVEENHQCGGRFPNK